MDSENGDSDWRQCVAIIYLILFIVIRTVCQMMSNLTISQMLISVNIFGFSPWISVENYWKGIGDVVIKSL